MKKGGHRRIYSKAVIPYAPTRLPW